MVTVAIVTVVVMIPVMVISPVVPPGLVIDVASEGSRSTADQCTGAGIARSHLSHHRTGSGPYGGTG